MQILLRLSVINAFVCSSLISMTVFGRQKLMNSLNKLHLNVTEVTLCYGLSKMHLCLFLFNRCNSRDLSLSMQMKSQVFLLARHSLLNLRWAVCYINYTVLGLNFSFANYLSFSITFRDSTTPTLRHWIPEFDLW